MINEWQNREALSSPGGENLNTTKSSLFQIFTLEAQSISKKHNLSNKKSVTLLHFHHSPSSLLSFNGIGSQTSKYKAF